MHWSTFLSKQPIFPGLHINIIDHYYDIYDSHFVMGGFNLELSHTLLSGFMGNHNYFNLIRVNTSFKDQGSCIVF